LTAIRRTLGRLERDPTDPHLDTRTFRTPTYGYMRTTPAQHADWHILWRPGESDDELVIVALSPLTF
jgi:hypothetical protein